VQNEAGRTGEPPVAEGGEIARIERNIFALAQACMAENLKKEQRATKEMFGKITSRSGGPSRGRGNGLPKSYRATKSSLLDVT